jgi:hypothetical protein
MIGWKADIERKDEEARAVDLAGWAEKLKQDHAVRFSRRPMLALLLMSSDS